MPDEEPIDLRDVDTIDTGDTVDTGQKAVSVKKPKNVFMREIVEAWPDVVLDQLYVRFSRLVEELDGEVTKSIKVEMNSEVLLTRIKGKAEELEDLIRKAKDLGLAPQEVYDFSGKEKSSIEEKDKLATILQDVDPSKVQQAKPSSDPVSRTPEEVAIDANIDRDMKENPETYRTAQPNPIPDRIVPKRIRQ